MRANRRRRRAPVRAAGLALLVASSAAAGSGCVGYLTGSYDAEVRRLRAVAAELEIRNVSLAKECLALRERVRELEDALGARSEGDGVEDPGDGPPRGLPGRAAGVGR